MAADGHLPEQPILFAWPSAGTVVGYVADKDAAAYSRDELVAMLGTLAADPDVGEITLFGHSMGGCWWPRRCGNCACRGKMR